MAPRKRNALKAAENSQNPMTPRRAEISTLKTQLEQRDQENETLRADLASITSQLENVRLPPAAPPVSSAPKPVVASAAFVQPDFSLIDSKLPDAPVRPTSAFFYYSVEARKTLKETHAGLSGAEQSRLIGQMWKELADKSKYEKMHDVDRARFDAEQKKYLAAVAKVEVEKDAVKKMYDERKKEAAVQFFEAALAAGQGAPAAAAAAAAKAAAVTSSANVETKKVEREAPKKPRTAFNLFCMDKREQLTKKNKGEKLPLAESMKVMSAEWAKLPNTKTGRDKLKKYNDKAAQDKERYAAEVQEQNDLVEKEKAEAYAVAMKKLEAERKYAVKTYGQQVEAEIAAKEERRANLQAKKEKRAQRENEPKRPKSAYIFFTMHERENVANSMPELKQKEIMEELGRRWRAASESDKKVYEDMAMADKERYATEMTAYNAQS